MSLSYKKQKFELVWIARGNCQRLESCGQCGLTANEGIAFRLMSIEVNQWIEEKRIS